MNTAEEKKNYVAGLLEVSEFLHDMDKLEFAVMCNPKYLNEVKKEVEKMPDMNQETFKNLIRAPYISYLELCTDLEFENGRFKAREILDMITCQFDNLSTYKGFITCRQTLDQILQMSPEYAFFFRFDPTLIGFKKSKKTKKTETTLSTLNSNLELLKYRGKEGFGDFVKELKKVASMWDKDDSEDKTTAGIKLYGKWMKGVAEQMEISSEYQSVPLSMQEDMRNEEHAENLNKDKMRKMHASYLRQLMFTTAGQSTLVWSFAPYDYADSKYAYFIKEKVQRFREYLSERVDKTHYNLQEEWSEFLEKEKLAHHLKKKNSETIKEYYQESVGFIKFWSEYPEFSEAEAFCKYLNDAEEEEGCDTIEEYKIKQKKQDEDESDEDENTSDEENNEEKEDLVALNEDEIFAREKDEFIALLDKRAKRILGAFEEPDEKP